MFSNSRMTAAAKKSLMHTWEGDSYSTEWCKKKCKAIVEAGGNAFYKKTGDKYTVYSF